MVLAKEDAEIVCDFCGTKYVFTHDDLRALAMERHQKPEE